MELSSRASSPQLIEATSVRIESDLRDILPLDGELLLTRFKRAETLRIATDTWAPVDARVRPARVPSKFNEPSGAVVVDYLVPEVAWRTVALADGGHLMVHQGARQGEIPLEVSDADRRRHAGSPYGGQGKCDSVVQTVLTHFDGAGKVLGSVLVDAVLAVDVAVSQEGIVAIAQAGARDPAQPRPVLVPKDEVERVRAGLVDPEPFGPAGTGVLLLNIDDLSNGMSASVPCFRPRRGFVATDGQVTAVAFTPDDRLVVQQRAPAKLTLRDSTGETTVELPLTNASYGDRSYYDTGHELFHRDVGAGVACASCHPEGGDDGHTWRFSGFGPRRTQAVNVGLANTAPFHWAGDMPDFKALLDEVMVGRMGGVHQSTERIGSLEQWLYSLPAPVRTPDDPAAARGRTLFEGAADCASCHSGPQLTNSETV
ncbi:MAG: hypothetical protein OXU20_10330 [Myxococcales bacterium]|nr:hypothetical protein [Myxococcales bacterium]